MKTVRLNDLLAVRPPKQIYTGAEAGCRCGCHGNYFEPGTTGFTRALNRAKKLNPFVTLFDNHADLERERTVLQHEYDALADEKGEPHTIARNALDRQVEKCCDGTIRAVAMDDGGWIDISLGNNKTITLYYK